MRKNKLVLLAVVIIVLALCFSTVAPTQAQSPAPSPTVPSWSRPNLHVYLVDTDGKGVAGLHVRFFDQYLPQGGQKLEIKQLMEGTTSAKGEVTFDVTTILCNKNYFLEIKETDDTTVVLPRDLNDPAINRPVGYTDPQTRFMSPIELMDGNVVYVKKRQLKPLVTPQSGAVRAVNLLENGDWIYHAPYGTDLSQIGVGGVVVTTTGQANTTAGTTVGQASGTTVGQTKTTSGATAGVTPLVLPGIGSVSSTPVPLNNTFAPDATPTQVCRGCGVAINPTVAALTVSYQLTQGIYTPAADGRNGTDRATVTADPPGVLTQRANYALTRNPGTRVSTPGAGTLPATVQTATPDTLKLTTQTPTGQTPVDTTTSDDGESTAILLGIVIVIAILAVGAVLWFMNRKKNK